MKDQYDTPSEVAADHLRAAARQSDDADTREIRVRLEPLLPGYELGARLGRGGMGVVFRARQSHLDRDVAVKVLLPPPGETAGWGERFQREARALAKLSHPGIVTIHDFGEADGLAWIVMEAVEGTNLRELLSGEALTPAEALAIAPGICSALQYAHEHGIVHRDVKPENVLVDTAGNVKLVDFGLAKLAGGDAGIQLTRTDQAMGTLRYMAPEQLDAPQTVDHRADIFSLGVVLYEMLTGQVPQGVIAPPSQRVEVDVRVDEIVLKSLEREPEQRFQRASDVAERVESIQRGPSEAAQPAPAAVPAQTEERPIDEQERGRAHRIGLLIDAGVALLVFAHAIAWAQTAQPETWDFLRLDLGVLLPLLCVPVAFGLVGFFVPRVRPGAVMRIVLSVMCVALAMVWRTAFTQDGAFVHEGWANTRTFYATLFPIILLPLVHASLGSSKPNGLRWGAEGHEILFRAGVAACVAAIAGAVMPWTEPYSAPQILFVIVLAAAAIETVRVRAKRGLAPAANARALTFAGAGWLAVVFVFALERFRLPIVQTNSPTLAVLAAGGLMLIGALIGAGTPRRSAT